MATDFFEAFETILEKRKNVCIHFLPFALIFDINMVTNMVNITLQIIQKYDVFDFRKLRLLFLMKRSH